MSSVLTPNPYPSRWSQCSIDELNDGFRFGNLNRCLFNRPSTSLCGNGLLEDGEACDCGSIEVCNNCFFLVFIKCLQALCNLSYITNYITITYMQECTNPCCNASTCQRTSAAQCATGQCCDLETCQLKEYGTPCRASNGSCDIAELCHGNSPECPADHYIRDGTECDGGNHFCFEGICQTLQSQCQLHFSKKIIWSKQCCML